MKKITLLIGILMSAIMTNATNSALALPLTSSTFFAPSAITDPTLEKGILSSTTGVVGQWNGASAMTATNAPTVENSSMYYSNYIENATGKQILLNSAPAQSPRYSEFTIATANTDYPTSATSYYLSALINISSVGGSGYILAMDKSAGGNGTMRSRLYVTAVTGGFQMSVGESASPVYNTTVYNYNQTYLVVLKYYPNCVLWVNPVLGGALEDSNTQSTATIGTNLGYIRSIDIVEMTGLSAKVSGLRFGTSWTDIAKVGGASLPALTTPSKPNDASSIGGKGFVATWSTVTSAVGYTINVYNGAALAKTVTVTGQTTASVLISGLTESTTYTYKVIANSDGSVNSNSVESDASNSFSTITLTPANAVVGVASNINGEWFTANWIAQTNVANYTIKVYDSTPTLVKTVNTPTQFGASVNNSTISGLALNTTYSYTVISNGDNIYTSNSSESSPSTSFTTLSTHQSSINTNFADGTWGVVAAITPNSTTYPSFSANGFEFSLSQVCNSSSSTGPKAEVHTHRLAMDKGSLGAMITLPTVASVSQLEIHCAAASTTLRTLTVQQFIGGSWTNIGAGTGTNGTGIYDLPNQTELIYVIPIISNNTNAKFRLVSSAGNGGSISIFQIITRTTTPTILTAPTVSVSDVASNISATEFTANWSTGDANAQGYKVFVYSGSTLVNTYNTTNENTLRSLVITGLTPSTTYTYKVGSLGDGDSSYSDSYVSATSASFSTLADLGTDVPKVSNNSVLKIAGKTIFSSEMGDIEIYNLQGSKIIEVRNTNKTTVNVANGLYIIRFRNDKGTEIIQKVLLK